jgi:hypothetical protein
MKIFLKNPDALTQITPIPLAVTPCDTDIIAVVAGKLEIQKVMFSRTAEAFRS